MNEFHLTSYAHGELHVPSVLLYPNSLLEESIEPWQDIENIWCDALAPILFQKFRSVRRSLFEYVIRFPTSSTMTQVNMGWMNSGVTWSTRLCVHPHSKP
jgi:hypothetical protein